MFGKDLATTNQEGHKNLEELGLKQTWVNVKATKNESNSLDRNDQDWRESLRRFRIMNLCSWCVSNEESNFDRVIQEIVGHGRMTDNGGDKGYIQFLNGLVSVLDSKKKVFQDLAGGCKEIARVRKVEKEKRKKAKAEEAERKLIDEEKKRGNGRPDGGSNNGNGVYYSGNPDNLF